jgi:hypothetical protein
MTAPPATRARTAALLGLGALAGPVYVVVGAAQAVLREGYDIRVHPLSMLANGGAGLLGAAAFRADLRGRE